MTHTPWTWLAATLCLSMSITGCGKQESDKPAARHSPVVPAASHQAEPVYPEGDVRRHFVAQAKPLLDEHVYIRLWAGSQKKDKPEILVRELDYPTLEYARDGVLYFIGDNQGAIVAIYPDGQSKVVVRSGVMGYVTPDGGSQPEAMNNTFEGLDVGSDGKILTLMNGVYPVEADLVSGKTSFLTFVLPSGKKIAGPGEYEPFYKEFSFESLPYTASIQSDVYNRVVIAAGDTKISHWFRYKKGQKIEVIGDPMDLPVIAYLIHLNPWGQVFRNFIPGPDGYIYAIEEGKSKQYPDRVIRIGDPGLSSLRKEASRVAIAEFKHGELTGALAFSPKGELAVGAKNAIYLITSAARGAKL